MTNDERAAVLLETVKEYHQAYHPSMTMAEAAAAFAADLLLATTENPTAAMEVLESAKVRYDIVRLIGELPEPWPVRWVPIGWSSGSSPSTTETS